MILVIDPHSGTPVYLQIIEQIRFHVTSGLLQAGDAIPSTRSLSAKLGINPMTVSKALSALESEGLLERRPGLPHVVRQTDSEALRASKLDQLESALKPVVTISRQLDIDPDSAADLFRRLLDSSEE
jgi:GntR family transcriptional regulator